MRYDRARTSLDWHPPPSVSRTVKSELPANRLDGITFKRGLTRDRADEGDLRVMQFD
jgi:hypothetical protein